MSFSQYKDKEVMGLSGAQSGDLLDLDDRYRINSRGSAYREETGPNYDMQQGQNVFGSSPPPASNYRNYGSLGLQESSMITRERAHSECEVARIADIDQIMKRHVDTLLDELGDVRTKFSQFESRTHNLENSINDLKMLVKNTAGTTDGKLRQLENILREVQNDVQVLRDKQEIADAQMQLAKLQAFKEDHQTSNTITSDPRQQSAPPDKTVQQAQTLSIPPTSSPISPTPPNSNAPPPCPPQQPIQQSYLPIASQQTAFPHQSINPPPNMPPPTHSHQNPSFVQEFPPPGQSQIPTSHQSLGPLPQSQQYGLLPPPRPEYVQQPPPQFPQNRPPGAPRQPQPPFAQRPEEMPPYVPQPQVYPPNMHPPPPIQHHSDSTPPSLAFYGNNPDAYEPSTSRVGSGQFPYPAGFPESYHYDASSPRYGNSKPSQFSSGGSSNLRLPRAEILPRAEPDSSDARTSVTVDDIVDQAAKMGFSRDRVKTTARKLTENGKPVDLNGVLDQLMNDSEVIQPQNIWRA